MVTVGSGEVVMTSTRAKGGSFPLIRVIDEPKDSMVATKRNGRIRTATKACDEAPVSLQLWHSRAKLGLSVQPSTRRGAWLHGIA